MKSTMNVFSSYFDLFKDYAETLAADPAARVHDLRHLPRPEEADAQATASEPSATLSSELDAQWDAFDDVCEHTRTEFGDLGGDGDSFYFFDSDTGSSVVL